MNPPWTIEMCPTRQMGDRDAPPVDKPLLVYPDGRRRVPTTDEVEMWRYVLALAASNDRMREDALKRHAKPATKS
jgi:hypothetical protein